MPNTLGFIPRSFLRQLPARATLLIGLWLFVLLQIRKIATILRCSRKGHGTASGVDRRYCAGSIVLQLVRPDIRQSCILLAAVKSCASHTPTASRTTAMIRPAIAPRRLSPCSGSVMPWPQIKRTGRRGASS